MRQIFLSLILVACLSGNTRADTFVPFVIPAKPNMNSPIAVTSAKPTGTDSERLVADSGHFYLGDKRVRLWGVNLSFGANLPKHEDAPHVAARLAVAGVNAVRCHHMDTARWPRGLWNAEDGKTISPGALDRLDYFIDQLARRGIYVNINLHVGREHSRYLGLPKTNRKYDKVSNIFTPALVEAQKQYARELLTRINPYRKVRYADDPAVAIVEITNENSFFMWDSETMLLRTLPPYYADILRSKFNTWLKKRYGSDKKLREAWAKGTEPLGSNLLKNSDFRQIADGMPAIAYWHVEQHAGCKASAIPPLNPYRSKSAVCIKPFETDDTDWHLQFNQRDFAVKAGQYYTVLFEAASDEPRQMGCSVGQAHSPWANLGLSRRAELPPEWRTFRFGFVAKANEDNARLSFSFGGSKIPIYFANVELRPGGRVSLDKGESTEDDSVALFANDESPGRTLDRMCFLAETEKAYFDGMRDFIKNDLGCKALVTGTIVFGPLGLYAQSDMDFIDAHAYWQHPRFPGRPWDRDNWLINQKPMTEYPSEATLFRLAAERLSGKPFTVSEYNHPAPLDSQAECVPMIASFAAAQDWDGVWLYTYSHSSDDWDRQTLNGYFDIDTNPAKWGFMRAGAAIFRDAGIQPLANSLLVSLAESQDLLGDLARFQLRHDRNMFALLSERGKISRDEVLNARLFAALAGKTRRVSSGTTSTLLDWTVDNGKGLYMVSGKSAAACAGHVEKLNEMSDNPNEAITSPAFLAVAAISLDGQPLDDSSKVLVTACGRCENAGMEFSENRQTVGRNWGGPPVQIEAVTGTMGLPEGQWKCEALGTDGMPKHEVPVSNGAVKLSPKYGTMWYLFTRY